MRGLAAVLAVTLLLAAGLAPAGTAEAPARGDVPPMPDDYIALATTWLEELETRVAAVDDAGVRANATRDLTRAREYLDEGRFRTAFSLFTVAESRLVFHEIWTELEAIEGDSAKRARLVRFGDTRAVAAQEALDTFRERLGALDGEISSLAAIESALYAGSIAMEAVGALDTYTPFRRQIQQSQPDVDAPLVRGIVNTGAMAEIVLVRTTEMLDLAPERDGVNPRVDLVKFRNFTASIREPMPENPQSHLRPYLEILASTMETDEDLLAFTAWSAADRAEALFMEQFRFGDAADRGVNAARDLQENVNRTLTHPILRTFELRGYEGLLARDALDFAWGAREARTPDVTTLVRAWIDLYHANNTARLYGQWSPVTPPEDDPTDPDGSGGDVLGQGEDATDASPFASVVAGALIVAAGVGVTVGLVAYARRR